MIPLIKEAIINLADDPRPHGYKKRKGEDGYRIRIGRYRVIYEIDEKEKTITIVDADHRKDIYK